MKRYFFLSYALIATFIAWSTAGSAQSADARRTIYLFDKDSKISYIVGNDLQSITVALKIGDSLQQIKLVQNGLEIWVDPKGKKNKRMGVRYPLPTSGNGLLSQDQLPKRNADDTGLHSIRSFLETLLRSKQEMELTGFRKELNGKQNISFQSGIIISIDFGIKDTLFYSVHIPFAAYAESFDFSHPLSVGIILKGMEQPDFSRNDRLPDGEGPGGGGLPPPPGENGFMPSGVGRSGPPDMKEVQKLFADNVIWQKITVRL